MTLDIVEGIMSGCSDYFGSFAPTALVIIDTLSQATDIDLLSRVVSTVSSDPKMCSHLHVVCAV